MAKKDTVRTVQFHDVPFTELVAQAEADPNAVIIKNEDGSARSIEHYEVPAPIVPTEQEVFDFSIEADMMKAGEARLITHYGNKSKAIRGLSTLGHKCGPISRALNIRFQHARNVLNKPLKRLIKEEREAQKNGVDTDLSDDE
jgi:hypothetical protein